MDHTVIPISLIMNLRLREVNNSQVHGQVVEP